MALWPSEEPRPRPDELKSLREYWIHGPQLRAPRGRSRWLWIAAGVVILFGVAVGARSYWAPNWVRPIGTSATTAAAPNKKATLEPPAAPVARPSEPSPPKLVTGLRPIIEPHAEPHDDPVQAQPPAATPEPQYAVGLRPIAEQVPPVEPEAVVPAPATGAPVAPSPRAKPLRKGTMQGQSPLPTSGQVRF
jgi:hypothetical protein